METEPMIGDKIAGAHLMKDWIDLEVVRALAAIMGEQGITEFTYGDIRIVRPLSLPVPRVLTSEEKLDEHEKKRKGTFLEAVAGSEGFKDFENTGTVGR